MLVNIQLLRLIAAMLVVLYHSASLLAPNPANPGALPSAGLATGFAGVDVFFVISGFIMAHTTLADAGADRATRFALRRLARIYSGHWPYFVLALLVFGWTRPDHVEQANLAASFFLWPQPLNLNLLEITWTLSFELYFYALFALLIWSCRPRKRPVACLLMAATLVLLNAWRHFALDWYGPANLYFIPFWDQFLLSPYVAEFFAGACVAYWLQKCPEGASWAWLAGGCALFMAGGWINNAWFDGHIEQGFHVVPRAFIFGSASIMIVTGLVRMERHGHTAPLRISIAGGGASYSIYLSHMLVISLLLQFPGLSGLVTGGTAAITATCLATMGIVWVCSHFHYRLIERPLHGRLRMWLGIERA